MRGRKPTPTNLKLLTGNPGRRPINLSTFSPEAAIPRCPATLKGEAKKEWRRVTKELNRYHMIAEVDRGLLTMLCTTWARFVQAEEMIETVASKSGNGGLFVLTPNKFPVQSPWLVVSNKAIETYKSLCAEFGLSPAARVRVTPQTTQMVLPGLELVAGTDVSLGSLLK